MGEKSSCYEKEGVRRGAWSADEDAKLIQYINQHGHGSWRNLPQQAGLLRCGKSCRLRWINYLRPDIKRGPFTPEEETSIIRLHGLLGNKWATIASHLPGRTDNEVKNFWNTRLKKGLSSITDTKSHHRQSQSCYRPIKTESSKTRHTAQWESVRVEAEARLSTESSLAGKTDHDSDIFLRLWNSEVGKSFRVISTKEGGEASASVVTQTYPPTKLDSGSFLTVQARAATSSVEITSQDQEDDIYRPNVEMMAGSDSMSSNDQFPDSSDTSALKLLLDNFPGDNMEFAHDHQTENHVPNFLDVQCDWNHPSDSSLVGTT